MDNKEKMTCFANETGLTIGPGDIAGPLRDDKGTLRWVVVTLDPQTKKIVFRWGKPVLRDQTK